jgi:hypothetical protein
MKHFRIDKLRKKLVKNEKWLTTYVKILEIQEKDLNHFCMFECSSTFVGYNTARVNKKIYENKINTIDRRFRIAGDVCMRLYNKKLEFLGL